MTGETYPADQLPAKIYGDWTLETMAESPKDAQWLIERHVPQADTADGERGYCPVCSQRFPCDLASYAATVILLSRKIAALEKPA